MSIDLTPEGLERIEGLAKAATPGPWKAISERSVVTSQSHPLCELSEAFHRQCLTETGIQFTGQDAAFIAAANPETILALVAEVKELRRIQEHQVREYAKEVVTNQQLVARVRELEKESDELWQVLYITANARDKTTAGKVLTLYKVSLRAAMEYLRKQALDGAKGGNQPSASSQPSSSGE